MRATISRRVGSARALGHRRVRPAEVDGQDVDAVREREVADERLELLDLAVRAARPLGEDEHRLAALDDLARLPDRLRAAPPCGRWP